MVGAKQERVEAKKIIRGMIYEGYVNCDKLFALYPEGNDQPLKCFMKGAI